MKQQELADKIGINMQSLSKTTFYQFFLLLRDNDITQVE